MRHAALHTHCRTRLQRQPSPLRVCDSLLRVVHHKQQSACLRAVCDSLAACQVGVALRLRVHERNSSAHAYSTEWLVIGPSSLTPPFPAIHIILRLETSAPPATISDAIGCKRSGRGDGVWQGISVVVCAGAGVGGRGNGLANTTVAGASVLMRCAFAHVHAETGPAPPSTWQRHLFIRLQGSGQRRVEQRHQRN